MSARDKSDAIYTAFDRWLDTKSLSLIEKFTREELKTALIECEIYKEMPPYLAMESRLEMLKDIEARTFSQGLSFGERVQWTIIGALVLFVAEIIVMVIWKGFTHWFE